MKGMHRYKLPEYSPVRKAINYDELNAEIFNPFENASYDDLDEYYKHRERHSIYAIKLTAVMAVMCLIGLIVSELLNN